MKMPGSYSNYNKFMLVCDMEIHVYRARRAASPMAPYVYLNRSQSVLMVALHHMLPLDQRAFGKHESLLHGKGTVQYSKV
jgi:hypothetical protein